MTELPPNTETANRRPIKSRGNPLIRKLASRLVASDVTPNQISQASVLFAALGFLVLWAGAVLGSFGQSLMLILAALLIQLRLLCNLVDGMVAVEGGKASRQGAFWNETPDRAADLLFFWGAGLFAGQPALGLGCGALAICTAYLRELGRAEGFTADFCGPMAKPHRMAALTLACVMAAFLPVAQSAATLMGAALWLILLGILATIARRSWRLLQRFDQAI